MNTFRFFHPIEVRYGDLDPQGHVNNAKYLTYLEQARLAYIDRLGLWDRSSFLSIGIILAEIKITFLEPILYGQQVQVGVRVTRLGNKSFTMDYIIQEAQSETTFATGTSVLVAYDYRTQESIPIPERWREVLSEFEGLQSTP